MKYETIKEGQLLRIVALKDFADVKAGDTGGLIESERNEEDTLSSRIQQLQEEIKTLKQQILDDNKAYGCELRDPYGTIWQYAEGVRKENEALKAAQAETDCTNWWPTVERFLQATGVKPAYWDETVPEQIERAIAEVAKKFSVSTVVHPCANGILPSPNAVYR